MRERSTTTLAILGTGTREAIGAPLEEGGDQHRGATGRLRKSTDVGPPEVPLAMGRCEPWRRLSRKRG